VKIAPPPGGTEPMRIPADLKTYTLSPNEIEALLSKDFGDKVQPVDSVLLAKHRQQRANLQLYNKFHKH
jgi:hypothetical protein